MMERWLDLIESSWVDWLYRSWTVVFLILALKPSVSFSEAAKYLCTEYPTYTLAEGEVNSLISSLRAVEFGRSEPLDMIREQCGLPGIQWRVCTGCDKAQGMSHFEVIKPVLADPRHREWHFKWHQIRMIITPPFDYVETFPPTSTQISEWVDSGWIPKGDFDKFANDHSIEGVVAGEDFLFMHRQMIKLLQVEMAARDLPCIAPWTELPASIYGEWQIPIVRNGTDAEIQAAKALHSRIRENLRGLRRPEVIAQLTLSGLGSRIEATIHSDLHALYSATETSCRNGGIDNALKCDDLRSNYASHVNFYFWKLHGLIDLLVGDWLDAHGYSTIATDCADVDPSLGRCYQWRGTWIGRHPN